jgi:hypothetical protein
MGVIQRKEKANNEVLFVEINVMKSCQSFVALYFT